jgi:hypothetical protein
VAGRATYEFLEHDLRLTATHDGHVQLAVQLRETSGRDELSATGVVRLVRGTEIPAEPAPGCAHTPHLAGTTGPLDGVWRFTSTPADLQAAGAGQADIVPENYGTYTFVIDRGRFAFTQEAGPSCTWGYGKFTVKGDRFDLQFTDGGGIAPDNAANAPGEFFTVRRSLYHDVMTLYQVNFPPNFLARPWNKISATPSRRFLNSRCPPPAGALPR